MQMKMKVGIGLMALGVGVWAGWSAWTRTRRVEPVDVPVKIVAGQNLTVNFRLNYDGLYFIEIAGERAKEAQLGVIGAEWTVRNYGREVKSGSTAEAHSAPGDGADARVIGEFNGRAGQSYELQVRFATDAPEAWADNAQLKVVVSGLARENLQAASVLVFSTMFICELFGVILVGVGLLGKRAEIAA